MAATCRSRSDLALNFLSQRPQGKLDVWRSVCALERGGGGAERARPKLDPTKLSHSSQGGQGGEGVYMRVHVCPTCDADGDR